MPSPADAAFEFEFDLDDASVTLSLSYPLLHRRESNRHLATTAAAYSPFGRFTIYESARRLWLERVPADKQRRDLEAALFVLLLELGVAFDRAELVSAVRRYLALPRRRSTRWPVFERLGGDLWAPALAYAAALPQDYLRYATADLDTLAAGDADRLDYLLAILHNCWALLGADSPNAATEVGALVDEVRGVGAGWRTGEALQMSTALSSPLGSMRSWALLAPFAVYHHLAAVQALAGGDPKTAQQHLSRAAGAADRIDASLSATTSLLAGAIAARTGAAPRIHHP